MTSRPGRTVRPGRLVIAAHFCAAVSRFGGDARALCLGDRWTCAPDRVRVDASRWPTLLHTIRNRTRLPRMTAPTAPAPASLAQRAAALCLDLKANDVVVLDVRGVTDMTDYFVIASGTSDTHVRSVAEHVLEELRKEGSRAHHVEGVQQGRWVLLDYVDMVVHIFHPTLREFYQLERLWGDATVVAVDQQQGALK